jgi:hypothetical protein
MISRHIKLGQKAHQSVFDGHRAMSWERLTCLSIFFFLTHNSFFLCIQLIPKRVPVITLGTAGCYAAAPYMGNLSPEIEDNEEKR